MRLLHLAWYGQDWAELNHGKEVRAQPGYSYENWLKAHVRLLDIGLKSADESLAVELPFSGYGPLTEAAVALADHVVERVGPSNPVFFCQANGWGPRGDWGAPDAKTEAAFDAVWRRPICRGQQAIQPGDYDWSAMFQQLSANQATYGEVYAPSFTKPHRDQLAQEIRKFADRCRERVPLGGVPASARRHDAPIGPIGIPLRCNLAAHTSNLSRAACAPGHDEARARTGRLSTGPFPRRRPRAVERQSRC